MKYVIALFIFIAVVTANVELKEYRLLEIIGDDLLFLTEDGGDVREFKIPGGSLGAEIRSKFQSDKSLTCTVLVLGTSIHRVTKCN